MSGVPKWEGFRVRKIPSSDSNVPQEEIEGGEQRVHVLICKVCKQPLDERESYIVCASCGHYAHAITCSNKYQMAQHDNLCIIELTKVSKRLYKVLYGFVKGYKAKRIRSAAGFPKQEFRRFTADLLSANLLHRKKLLILSRLVPTYLTFEVFPVLEEIYRNEMDVQTFIKNLEAV